MYAAIRSRSRSKVAGSMGMLTSPHHTVFSVVPSFTQNLSLGLRPVNSPVSTAKAPLSTSTPWPFTMVCSTSSAGSRFQ